MGSLAVLILVYAFRVMVIMPSIVAWEMIYRDEARCHVFLAWAVIDGRVTTSVGYGCAIGENLTFRTTLEQGGLLPKFEYRNPQRH